MHNIRYIKLFYDKNNRYESLKQFSRNINVFMVHYYLGFPLYVHYT